MATAGAVVDRLLRRLAADARRLELPPNIEEDAAHVGRTLARFQDVLVSMEMRYFRIGTDAQEWMERIRQIAYDMEDLLDEFADPRGTTRSPKSGSWIAKAASFCSATPFFLHISRSERMKCIRRKLDISTEDSLIYSLMQRSSYDLKPSYNKNEVFDAAAVIGRDNDKKIIKSLLMQDHADKLAIIPIVGPAGSGKTTLARLVFHDKTGGEWNPELRIWVHLDKKLELNKIAQDIISQAYEMENIMVPEITSDDQIRYNRQLIKNRLGEILHDKSSLIVLDDMYSTDKIQLAELKDMLRGKNKCTKIIVTTSSETTAELVHSIAPYKLGHLSEDDCWKIFSQKAFSNPDENRSLVETGKQIVKICEGMPGIAYSLGSVMCNRDDGSWLWARDKEIWELEKRFSSGLKILAPFSELYYNMPSTLKLCFGYLSIFPKGSTIDKDKLVQQWMALDMVGSKHGTLPAHVHGEMYIQELLSMFFLRIQEMPSGTGISHTNGPVVVQMHNLVHAFANYVAGNDLIILDAGDLSNGPSAGEKISYNYVVVKNDAGQSTPKKELLTKARAVSFKNCSASKFLADAISELKHLRVLDLTRCHIVELPSAIGGLKHLRYLDCSGLKIRKLPNQMSSLRNLEALVLSESYLEECPTFVGSYLKLTYLNLQGCHKLQTLPPTLGDLKRLQYLNLSDCPGVSKVLEYLCGLHKLRTLDLSGFTELQQFPHLFAGLTNLEDLNLSGCSRLDILPESFGNLVSLRFLNLSGCSELQQLPESIIGLVNLQYLNLAQVHLELPKYLSKLERLHTLDITGYRLQVSPVAAAAFSSIIQNMPNLKLLLTDDSNIENYTSQHIQWSTDVGKQSFQIRNIVKTGESPCAPEGAKLVQMQTSPYPLLEANSHEKVNKGTQEEITEVEVSSTGGQCPESSAGTCSNFAYTLLCIYSILFWYIR
ncbi:hypothetical protein PVAP13_2KG129500 [Panicum virgatum]|uniref:Uncharacterized protein n=1 Tax=Panicum virgatum TaxID=38727 RepID=A0A8T0W0K9_PANVG|nr:hypothetical protein PVAP13_2KG129500 [Panicum virgatum]